VAGPTRLSPPTSPDIPDDVLAPLGIAVVDPDDFLLDQLDLAPRVVLDALREQAAHTRNPPLTPTDLLARLARAGAPAFADEAGRMIWFSRPAQRRSRRRR
jgi:hypothetical protein